ncbi:hypothetical protein MPTK1_6g17090 [Marchantia polymorpha subsp. ruderalis]|uniref:Uncharacterized protein n=2 Tax=Marchantia polymorpha TaxID=3197 RepID=A0AAF6BSX2_MARPO|nr:hypothetical protein MARPO_0144s0006 [Marchantia polymorpha]BBN15106.1 hypothetical protein Mp_6g17090 [Marchantia polymorpha subsp. ruderalis]|eukprot:PTQ29287.1 hypothetical protein MARPO_0144s0006 [Marchantia polymorpha]
MRARSVESLKGRPRVGGTPVAIQLVVSYVLGSPGELQTLHGASFFWLARFIDNDSSMQVTSCHYRYWRHHQAQLQVPLNEKVTFL